MNVFCSIGLLLALAVLCGASYESDFHDFAVKYKRPYLLNQGTAEYNHRFQIFKNNLDQINSYNAQNNGVTLGVNQFADLTKEERRAKRLSLSSEKREKYGEEEDFPSVYDLPPTFSWVNEKVVGPVKNQGDCGSSFVFDIVDSISSIWAIEQSTNYRQLSVEQVVTCSGAGCDGGQEQNVITYIKQHGLQFNSTINCPSGRVSPGVCINGSACSQAGNETALAYALYGIGPLLVEIDGSHPSFEFYETGIYYEPACSSTNLDTSLLLVGYTEDAWLCQNSWGTAWGMKGYILMARNRQNNCGIATNACYPTGVSEC